MQDYRPELLVAFRMRDFSWRLKEGSVVLAVAYLFLGLTHF